jgi:hypothetical protein
MLSFQREDTASRLEQSVSTTSREVSELIDQLEGGLTDHQSALLHQLRLAAESLGAMRAALLVQRR